MAANNQAGDSESLQIPFSRIATFVRQVTHDVRNNLNSMDLQAAYVNELVKDPEAVAEVRRIRDLIQTSARHLQALSTNFQTASLNLVTYNAKILVEDLRDRLSKTFPTESQKITWKVNLDEESLEVDVEAFFGALTELFRNAIQFGGAGAAISVEVENENGYFALQILEAKPAPATPPETWGMEPFVSTRRSGYGLGLFRTRRTLSLHHGGLTIFYDSKRAVLVSRVLLPLATPT